MAIKNENEIPLYIQCKKCERSWKLCMSSLDTQAFVGLVKYMVCPHCNNADKRMMSLSAPPKEEGGAS